MKKRKKKLSPDQLQQLNKAHHRNDFYMRLKTLCVKLGLLPVYNILDKEWLDYIYLRRCQSLRVVAADGSSVPPDVIETAKAVVSVVIKNVIVPMGPDKSFNLSIYEYFTVYLTLILNSPNLFNEGSPKRKFILEALEPFVETQDEDHTYISKLFGKLISNVACFESDFRHKIYMMHHRLAIEYKGTSGVLGLLEIHSEIPETKNFIINGITRPAIRVEWGQFVPEPKFVHSCLTPEQLNINILSKTLKLPVFIQSHALQRLIERLDVVYPGFVIMNMCASLQFNLKVNTDKSGNIMLDMLINEKKVGYLLADIVDSSVVIRTFLFLTHTGTPEGNKLLELTGLEKEDKSYLEIDKLSTFLGSDIQSNEKLKNIFIKAGCESLFHLDSTIFDTHDKLKPKAEKILAYLGLDKTSKNVEEGGDFEKKEITS